MTYRRLIGLCLCMAVCLVLSTFLVACGDNTPTTAPSATTAAAGAATSAASNATTSAAGVATSAPNASSGKGKELQLVMILKGHPVHRIVQLGFMEEARKLGYEPKIIASDGSDPQDSISLGEQAMADKPVGVIVWAFSPVYYPYIKKLSDANINVVVPHFPIAQGDAPGIKANLGADPVAYAKEAADAIGIKVGGKGTVALTQGSFNTTENLVAKTFMETMKSKYPGIKVLDPQEEGFDPPAAISKAVSIITANPDLVGAFSTTGGGPTTWASASDQAKKPLAIIGMDYTHENLDLVKSGKVLAIVAQPLYDEAAKSVDYLDQLLKGESVPYTTVMPSPLVKADTADTYLEIVKRSETAK